MTWIPIIVGFLILARIGKAIVNHRLQEENWQRAKLKQQAKQRAKQGDYPE